ncbi:Arginine-tRNA-protein transferase 1 [Pleurostoma richardsiae]|uniref:arginyltransferase n=1 Tax=Pleurostoma richardsiae TaxID=41990 RepID=A0AA38R1T2_9PEZI|nr:Arginine-tRNA-protein transferase 1 [Pleurostoma richardsiae]
MEGTNMQTPEAAFSYISPIGYSNSADCGYCRKSRSGFSYYASASSLNPEFYQRLVDRCWRRSGTLLYRPNQRNACCPHYTLRLDSSQFKPAKDQRQAVNRFNRFVAGDAYAKEAARRYPRSHEEVRKRDAEFDLVERIHEAELRVLKTPPQPAHEFTVTLEPDTFTEEKYVVFENYQRIVHQEPPSKITRHGFKRFLCNSPLRRKTYAAPDGRERRLGSFHQCYRLDGKLVAVGVLDLLPDCVSAVYFLYHESVHVHNPGKLGALREIALAIEGGYRWWYSGYYIHSCPKMRYKIDYSPQYVLDPETLVWHLLDKDALSIFDRKHYVSLSRERQAPAGDATEDVALITTDNKNAETSSTESGEEDAEEEDSLLASNMPGILSLEELSHVDLDHIRLRSDYADGFFKTSDLIVWANESLSDPGSLKSKIAELVAAVGPDLIPQLCLDFRRSARS